MKKKIIFVSGRFNVLHPGHIRFLRFAKELGDQLIVGVESDKLAGYGAHVKEDLRLEGVSSSIWVDKAILINEPVQKILKKIKPDIVVKGKEHEKRFNPEQNVMKELGGRLIFSSGENVFSSIDLIRKEFYESSTKSINLPRSYLDRHKISLNSLKKLLSNFSSLKVCVIGDLIIDEYISCQPLGMSQEDPTLVITPIDSTQFVGGAGIVAAHSAGLGASVNFITIAGEDVLQKFALDQFARFGVNAKIILDDSRKTTLKQRFRSRGKTLLRVNNLNQGSISQNVQNKLLEAAKESIEKSDLLVFSDFNYGCLPQNIVDALTLIAKKRNILICADSQSSSQMGNVGRFKNMDLLTPTEYEARISTRNYQDGLVVLAEQLKKESSSKNVLLKLAEEGLLIHTGNMEKEGWLTDRIDALNITPKDVAGAGDSLLITSAMTLAAKGNIWQAAILGSLASAIQIGRVGNTPLKIKEIIEEIQ